MARLRHIFGGGGVGVVMDHKLDSTVGTMHVVI